MSKQSNQEKAEVRTGRLISSFTLISLVEKKESKSLRIACPIPPPLPACLRVAARGLQLLPSAAGRLLFSLSRPPGFRRAREEWIAGARAGRSRRGPVQWVGWSGLVWRELERERERERERRGEEEISKWCGVCLVVPLVVGLAAGLGLSAFAVRLPHGKTTHAVRIFALLGVSACGFGFLKPHA